MTISPWGYWLVESMPPVSDGAAAADGAAPAAEAADAPTEGGGSAPSATAPATAAPLATADPPAAAAAVEPPPAAPAAIVAAEEAAAAARGATVGQRDEGAEPPSAADLAAAAKELLMRLSGAPPRKIMVLDEASVDAGDTKELLLEFAALEGRVALYDENLLSARGGSVSLPAWSSFSVLDESDEPGEVVGAMDGVVDRSKGKKAVFLLSFRSMADGAKHGLLYDMSTSSTIEPLASSLAVYEKSSVPSPLYDEARRARTEWLRALRSEKRERRGVAPAAAPAAAAVKPPPAKPPPAKPPSAAERKPKKPRREREPEPEPEPEPEEDEEEEEEEVPGAPPHSRPTSLCAPRAARRASARG